MAFLFRAAGAATTANNSAGPLAPALPAGVAVGDLLVVQFQNFGGTNARVPSIANDWTSYVWQNGTASHLVAWKIAGSGESAPSITLTGTGANNDTQLARVFAFYTNLSGYAIELDVAGTNSTNASADNVGPITGVTVGATGNLTLVSSGKTNDWNGAATLANYTAAGLTESTTGNDAGMSLLYRLSTPSGGTGNLTVTDNGGTASNGAGFGTILSFDEFLPPITGAAEADFGFTVTAAGTVTAPPATAVVARGVVKPVRTQRAAPPRPRAILLRGADVVAPITGTATASIGVSVTATGIVTAPSYTGSASALFGVSVTAAATVTPPAISGTATALFGLTVASTGAVIPPAITGTGSVSLGLTATAAGTVSAPGVSGSATALLGLSVAGSGTYTLPVITGVGTALVGLTVSASGTVTPPAITGSATSLVGLTVAGSGTATPPAITGGGLSAIGLTVTASGTADAPSISGTATTLLGITVSSTGTVVPPAITGTGTATLGLTVTGSGTVTQAGITGTATVLLALQVSASGTVVDPPLSGTATALVGLTVTSSGTMTAPLGNRRALVRLDRTGPRLAVTDESATRLRMTDHSGGRLRLTASSRPRLLLIEDSGSRLRITDRGLDE